MLAIFGSLKRFVKKYGVLKGHVWCFRSQHPLKNLVRLRSSLMFGSVFPRTGVSYDRLQNIYDLALALDKKMIQGSFVECGVSELLGIVAKEGEENRYVHLFDSFEGLPNPTVEDAKMAFEFQKRGLNEELKPIGLYLSTILGVLKFLFKDLKLSPN